MNPAQDGGRPASPSGAEPRKGKRRRKRHEQAGRHPGHASNATPSLLSRAAGAAGSQEGDPSSDRSADHHGQSSLSQNGQTRGGPAEPGHRHAGARPAGHAGASKGRPRSLQGRPLPAHEAKASRHPAPVGEGGSAGRNVSGSQAGSASQVGSAGRRSGEAEGSAGQLPQSGLGGAEGLAAAQGWGTARPPGRGAGQARPMPGAGWARSQSGASAGDEAAPLYAALDLGTNNCRLLIAQPTRPGQFRVVDAFSRIVRLGEGLAASGRLSDEAMHRAVEALKVCAVKLAGRPVRRRRLIATEAARRAENGAAFMARVAAETGLELEIIDRETEARLAVSGCSSLVGREARSVVLFDIGGGSSEIAVLKIGESRSSRLANHITHWTSLPVGVVTLSERHGGRDVTPERFEAMVQEVEAMLSGFDCPAIETSRSNSGAESDFYLIGTSGTVTTLAGVHLDLPRYDRRRVDGVWLTNDEVTAMQARLLSWDFAARAANPCIGPDRADLVLAGCAILEAIRRRWPSTRMRVADRGLREGLLTDMMADDGVWRRGRPRRGA
ncbi:exopolyphosphatase [Rhizobium sp. CC-YZS058]|uniref:Ppx/GppA phosphatase family protein n=1 Tax=Rhizobium sp. CC-YZS058 TaxID=3042153 RepID=UPI003A4C6ED7